jgi:predicted PurR-regulated permease PerM
MSKLHLDEATITSKVTEASQTVITWIFNQVKDFTQNSLEFVLMFILMLYALFFFLRDGEKLLKKIIHLSPLGEKYEIMLYDQFTSTARATLKGTVIVGVIQGVLGGLLFAIAGIPGALIWGVIMTILSVLPGIGCALVWFPAALILILLGDVWQGVMIMIVGTLVIGTIDNILRPFLVGKDIRIHELLIFFPTLGGILVFGASGFIIGPIIASLFVALWNIYEHYYRTELSHNK